MHELILINISGEDKPGLTAAITGLLSQYEVDILDIGQAVIHNFLALGILVRVSGGSDSSPILKDVLYGAHELGVSVRFSPIAEDSYENWVGHQGSSRNILTLLARKITAGQIARVSEIVFRNGLNIDNIVRLSGRIPLDDAEGSGKSCIEFSLRGELVNPQDMRSELMKLANEMNLDIAVQEDNVFRRNRRLIAFDMDSTLIETEVIDELAAAAGVGDKVARITERAMRGEIDFRESLEERVSLLAGLGIGAMEEIGKRLPLMEGADHLFTTLSKLGYKTAIISGGFTYFGDILRQRLGIDYLHANRLEIREGRLTGKVLEPIVDAEGKARLLAELAEKESISMQQVIAVGDGANDLAMLNAAGLGIAFRAKPMVKQSAGHAITNLGLDAILYLMGIRDRDA